MAVETETRTCRQCAASYALDATDFAFYEKMGVPPPVLCSMCRFRRRAVFRNERTLYNGVCALCKKKIITMYNPSRGHIVYCNDCWLSDKWDPFSYARVYDVNRSFFDQLKELVDAVPKAATYSSSATGPNINSEYCNFAGGNKDCYLVFNSGPENENCAYSRGLGAARDAFDVYFGTDVERVYEGVDVHKSTGVLWSDHVTDSIDSAYLLNCSNCINCFGCVNLRHKSNCFLNEQLSKEEWKRRTGEIMGSFEATKEFGGRFKEFSLKFPRRENSNFKSVGSDGDYIFNSKNCRASFEVQDSEDVRHSFAVRSARDCYDMLGHGRQAELFLEGVGSGKGARSIGTWWVEVSHDVDYSFATRSSEFCIGCAGVRNAKYAVLNKQYGEEQYKELRAHIVEELKRNGDYGLFFPPEFAFFAYNETVGQDNLPMTKEETLAAGFRWEDKIQMTKGKETMRPKQIPDHINDVPESIVSEILACTGCDRNYRLIKPELEFYKKTIIPIPRKCFNCRFADRIARRGSFVFYDRTCAKCSKPIKTNYAPDPLRRSFNETSPPEIVYCEQCYNAEVV